VAVELLAEALDALAEERADPLAAEQLLGVRAAGRDARELRFCRLEVERRDAAAALDATRGSPLVRRVAIDEEAQERPQARARRVERRERLPLQGVPGAGRRECAAGNTA
jgi:hypothetical protein